MCSSVKIPHNSESHLVSEAFLTCGPRAAVHALRLRVNSVSASASLPRLGVCSAPGVSFTLLRLGLIRPRSRFRTPSEFIRLLASAPRHVYLVPGVSSAPSELVRPPESVSRLSGTFIRSLAPRSGFIRPRSQPAAPRRSRRPAVRSLRSPPASRAHRSTTRRQWLPMPEPPQQPRSR